MPTLPLMLYPVWFHLLSIEILTVRRFPRLGINCRRIGQPIFRLINRSRQYQFLILIAVFMTFGRLKWAMYALMRQIDKERFSLLTLLIDKLQGMIRQQIRHVSTVLVLDPLSIRINPGIIIFTLSLKSFPMVKAGLGRSRIIAHVPLTEKGRPITRRLKILREEGQTLGKRRRIIHYRMLMRIHTRQDRGPAWRRQGSCHESVLDMSALTSHTIH